MSARSMAFASHPEVAAEPVAIVGVGCRFPGAPTPEAFWKLTRSGDSALGEVPLERWNRGDGAPRWRGGFVDGVDGFDWRAWRMVPDEARHLDPQQRLLLEVAAEAFEDAGAVRSRLAGSRCGVFVSLQWNDYFRLLRRHGTASSPYEVLGNVFALAANRISHAYGLRGPSLAVDGGCASALVGLSLAVQAIRSGSIDCALVGTAELMLSPDAMLAIEASGMLSRRGASRPLQEDADGVVRSEGVGAVVLKPLSRVEPWERVYALVRAVEVEHNGANDWITAPRRASQEELIERTCAAAGVSPADVQYVEAHSGGGRGDREEIAALSSTYGRGRADGAPCLVGAAKAQMGHLGISSAMLGLIRAALALHHGAVPPTRVAPPSPGTLLDGTNLATVDALRAWPAARPRLAAVNALSLGGVNGHAILESARPAAAASSEEPPAPLLLALSARSHAGLGRLVEQYAAALAEPGTSAADLCFTAGAGRDHHPHRLAVAAGDAQGLVAALRAADLRARGVAPVRRRPQVLLRVAAVEREEVVRQLAAARRLAAWGIAADGVLIDARVSSLLEGIEGAAEWRALATAPDESDAAIVDLATIDGETAALACVAALYERGVDPDWWAIAGRSRRITSAPTYPWQRERMWPQWLTPEFIGGAATADGLAPPAPQESGAPALAAGAPAIAELVASVLGVSRSEIRDDQSLVSLGIDSMAAHALCNRMQAELGHTLTIAELFAAKTLRGVAAALAGRAACQREGASPRRALTVDAAARFEPFPLTDIQEAYLVGSTPGLELGGVSCHYYQEFDVTGLDVARLERSFGTLIARHDMLRAVVVPGTREQRILAEVPEFHFGRLDLSRCDDERAQRLLAQTREQMAERAFAADQWPLFDVLVSVDPARRTRLHLSFDLLMLDASSLSQLLLEWRAAYAGDPAPPAPGLSFRDYVLWQRAERSAPAFERARQYWLARLPALRPGPELPAERQPGAPRQRRRYRARLDSFHWARLKARAAALGATPSGVLAAAFREVLSAWSKSAHFSIVLTTCRRDAAAHADVPRLLGDFTTTTILCVEPGPGSFGDRVAATQQQLNRDLEHGAFSGVEVLRELSRSRDVMAAPLVPVVFTSLVGHGDKPEVLFSDNWLGPVVHGTSQTPQVSLDYQAFEESGALVYQWDVLDGEYTAGVVDDMFAAYQRLLGDLACDEAAWRRARAVTVPARDLALREALHGNRAAISDATLTDLFERQVALRPDAVAVVSAEARVTYAELDGWSSRLARVLRERGARKNTLIGVLLPRGPEQIAAVLAILRSGAAYLPLSVDLPDARIDALCRQAEVALVVTDAAGALRLPPPVHGVLVDERGSGGEEAAPGARRAPTDLAYTIFTSGSTGQPKGVMIDDRGAVNTVLDVNRRFDVGPGDRVLALSSIGFDLSVYDVFGMLAAGGTIVVPTPGQARDPAAWLELVQRHRVTLWNSVPALMKMLVDWLEGRKAEPLSSLRVVLLSGDWIPVTLPDAIGRLAPGARTISLGGATEASIWSILYPIEAVDARWSRIPYGLSMVNQRVCVLDEAMEEVPNLVVGEIHIGGIGVALGYWGNAEETARRFVVHPRTGERWFKTGDLGLYRPDGHIEILGRADFQMKISGHRIEPGEIEAALCDHEAVSSAVVVAPTIRGGRQLVAFVVPARLPAEEGLADRLTEHLVARLPRYMVPARILFVESIPVTANAKVDRAALERVVIARPAVVASASHAPVGEAEARLLAILRSTLKCNELSVSERFADLGCTSLEIVIIHREVRREFGVELPIADLFRCPDVASLASLLSTAGGSTAATRAEESGGASHVQVDARQRQRLLFARRQRRND